MNDLIKAIIVRFSTKWDIPEEVLIRAYRLYQVNAAQYGDILAFMKGMGFVLNKRKLLYFFKSIKTEREIVPKIDSKLRF